VTRLILVALVVFAASAASATATTPTSSLSGSGVGSGVVSGDRLEVSVTADPTTGAVAGDAEGQFTLITSQFNDGGAVVCLRFARNKVVVLYRLRTAVTVPELPGEVFPYGAAYIEDNGDPVRGQPVDRMLDYVVREVNVHFFCDADPANFFDAALATPISSGNFVVTDGASG
jgi:hypothetical protein